MDKIGSFIALVSILGCVGNPSLEGQFALHAAWRLQ